MNWSSWYGEVIQGVFNITPTPTVLQLICWLAYLAIVLTLFVRPRGAHPKEARSNESEHEALPERSVS